MVLAKTKLNTIDMLVFKALFDSYINHDQFDSVINMLWEYNEMREEIRNPKNDMEYTL